MAEVKHRRTRTPSSSHRDGTRTRWVRNVKTVSTFPPPGTLSKCAEEIARVMASPRVSPKGIGSAIRMIQFVLNRGGRNLSAARRRELEKAKRLLRARRLGRSGAARA